MAKVSPIAFVLPWYGPDVAGGAETDARHLVEHLSAEGVGVEVWTTCAQQLGSDWNRNHHRPGRANVNGVSVTRFPVTPMEREQYWTLHRRLSRGRRITPEQEALLWTQSIRSRSLCDHIWSNPAHICVFTPYIFGTTYWGAYVAPERSFLIPCLHDEGFARQVSLRQLFRAVRGVLCNTRTEMDLVRQLYGLPARKLAVIGDGIEVRNRGDAQRFRDRYGITEPFLLYAGRKSVGKNTPLLLTYFNRYRRRRDTSLKLVLIGEGRASVPPECRSAVYDLGFVPEQDKQDAYAAATVFSQPSVNESFSIVLMEAWIQGTPAIVNARCDVTREHCEQGQGGLYFRGYQEFEVILDLLLSNAALRKRLGKQGRCYVERNFTWDQVMERFLNAVYGVSAGWSNAGTSKKTAEGDGENSEYSPDAGSGSH